MAESPQSFAGVPRDAQTSSVTNPDSTIIVHSQRAELALSGSFPVGHRVAAIGPKAHRVHRVSERVEVLGPRHSGFDLDYVPIEARVWGFKV